MIKETFYCDSSRDIFKKKTEKGLFLEITDTMITGKGNIYLENRRNEYIGDINYKISTITRFEKTADNKGETLVIYVRSSSLYGVEKVQIRLPGLKDINKACKLLTELMEKNKDSVNSVTASMVIPSPIQSTEIRRDKPAAPAATPAPAAPAAKPVTPAPAASTPASTAAAIASTPRAAVIGDPATGAATTPMTTEEYQKKLARLETIYQTGIMTEKEYRQSKAEYISGLRGIEQFFNKVKVNLQYSEIGFLSEAEFTSFKKSTVDECTKIEGVASDTLKQNLSKLYVLNICEILTNEEYGKICTDIVKSVQYSSTDAEASVVEKIQKWPVLKECEIITEAQFNQFVAKVTEDIDIKPEDSITVLERKLKRFTTVGETFILAGNEFSSKKQALISSMTTVDYSSDAKLKTQLERIMALRRFDWLSETEYSRKKAEILNTISGNSDIVEKMMLYGLLTDISFISKDEYNNFKNGVIDGIFKNFGDINELQTKAQALMSLKNAGVITEAEFTDYKQRLLSI